MASSTSSHPAVAVVMSTYNGERYLKEQIDSILAQAYPNMLVHVRDDGSSDGTLALLADYEKRGLIEVDRGQNVGVTSSFYLGIAAVVDRADYVVLCDQDDVWHADKVERAIGALGKYPSDTPLLHYTEVNYCDGTLVRQGVSHLCRFVPRFEGLFFENCCSGNVTTINQSLAKLVLESGPERVFYHDWWIALLCACFGHLVYDPEPSVEYRRTGENVSPTGAGIKLAIHRLKEALDAKRLSPISGQLEKLLDEYGDAMADERRAALELFCTRGYRLRKALYPHCLRQTLAGEAAVRLLLLLGRL